MTRIALPAGDLRAPLAAYLEACGLAFPEYAEGSRSYRPVAGGNGTMFRVFRERDIPIQVALGNYDLAICSQVWVEEFLRRAPGEAVVVLRALDLGRRALFAAAAPGGPGLAELAGGHRTVTIVSEYEGLATGFALAARLPRFRVVPVWGSAEAYPPEDADLAVVTVPDEGVLAGLGLRPVHRLLDSAACLIANAHSLRTRPMGQVLQVLEDGHAVPLGRLRLPAVPPGGWALDGGVAPAPGRPGSVVRLAVPDGHQQRHAHASLAEAGLSFEGYGENEVVRRPASGIPGLEVKVIRPQDMAQQVAIGQFDLAITGRDWLQEHLYQFPTSPVRFIADLGRGAYTIAAVVEEDLPATTLEEALRAWGARGRATITVASEYRNIADHYARERQLGRYRVVPIAGASEGFVPDDAEILIEGTETGTTLRANRLRVLDPIFHSTSCLIGGERPRDPELARLWDDIARRLSQAGVAAGV